MQLAYAGSEFLTGDAIATALLDYSQALADAGTAGSVEIPIIGDDGTLTSATFLVGPASQIVATHAHTSHQELVDDEAVARIDGLTRRLRPVAFPVDVGEQEDFDSEM